MEMCGGSITPRQGRVQSSSSVADQDWTIGAVASGLAKPAEGELGAVLGPEHLLNVSQFA